MRQRQEMKLIEAIVGVIVGLIGLILLVVWWFNFLVVFKGLLPFLLLVFGVWMVLRMMRVSLWDVRSLLFRSLEGALGRPIGSVLQLHCPSCGATAPQVTKFCLHCGSPLPQPKICPKCQRVNVSEAKFCGYCGAEFDLR